MSLSDLSFADLAAISGNNKNDGFGGDGLYGIIVLFILLGMMGNGWGGFGGGFGGGNGGGVPFMTLNGDTQRGFDQAAVMGALGDINGNVTGGFAGINQALCGGFAGVNATVNSGFANAETAENARQMANMNQLFGLQSSLQNCCCENRANIADLKYTIATENCQDRQALSDGVRDIITNEANNTQKILDKLCALELDGVKAQLASAERENLGLQNQLNMATLRESQATQNAFIAQGLTNEVDALYNRLKNCPVPSMPVYGMQPVFTCRGTCPCSETTTPGTTT